MADIAARREARRRKILENSESRLQRISGQTNNAKITDIHEKKCEKSDLDSLLTNLNANGILPSESLVNSSWDDPIEIENEIIQSDLLNSNILNKRRNFVTTTHENVCTDNGIINGQDYQTRHNTPDEYRNISSGQANQKLNTPSEITFDEKDNKQSMIMNIFVSRSIYVLLAAMMNLMLIMRMERAFGTSVIIPFFLIFSTRLWILDQLSANQRNESLYSMIIAALILCNVRPNVIFTLKKIFYFANQFINDMALFIFNFVIMHYFITQYWTDFHVTLDNKVEIIVDRHETT